MRQIPSRRAAICCFVCYCAALAAILFLRGIGGHPDFSGYPYWRRILDRVSLVPFSTIGAQLGSVFGHGSYGRMTAIRNLTANLLLFVPMGVFLPLLWRPLRRFSRGFALWMGMILAIELVQLLTLQGSFDVDDVILNTMGFFAGYAAFSIANHVLGKEP